MGMEEEDNIWRIFWRDLPLLQRDASSWLNVAANQNVMGGVTDTALVWLAPHYAVAGVRLSRTGRTIITRVDVDVDLVIWLKLLCSLLNYQVITVYYFQVVLFLSMFSLCCFCLRSRLHFMLTNIMYFYSLSHILLNKLLLNSGGRNSDSACSKMYDLIPRSLKSHKFGEFFYAGNCRHLGK